MWDCLDCLGRVISLFGINRRENPALLTRRNPVMRPRVNSRKEFLRKATLSATTILDLSARSMTILARRKPAGADGSEILFPFGSLRAPFFFIVFYGFMESLMTEDGAMEFVFWEAPKKIAYFLCGDFFCGVERSSLRELRKSRG